MFTGLVETVGTVKELQTGQGSARITIESDLPVVEMQIGESVAVNGVCLTVTALGERSFRADAVSETLKRSTLSLLSSGDKVNLERALRVGERLAGHLVQGHVDCTARLVELIRRGDDCRFRFQLSSDIRRYVAEKGSVAIDGVSLTVSGLTSGWFEVALIPATLAATTLGYLRKGDRVNVEVDLIARYLERLNGGKPGQAGALYGSLPTRSRQG